MLRFVIVLLVVMTLHTRASDFYVDPAVGDERANGLAAKIDGANGPVKTIATR
jgi:hypothetical protein